MKIIKQSHEILNITPNILQQIEVAGRTCYKSEDKITGTSAEGFVRRMIKSGHEAMIEFGDITVKFITNRGISHEIVRHRLFSFAQESTRYVKYDGDMEFILPVWFDEINRDAENEWWHFCNSAEHKYKQLLALGWKPEQAREVLPNSLKTEICVKGNARQWRVFFKLRCSKAAHPQMRSLARGLLVDLQSRVPVLFDNI